MSDYFDKNQLFMEPTTNQYGNHMVMTNVHKMSKTKYINIDTKFRDEYDFSLPANFNINLPERVNSVHSIKVTNIEIPMTFYNISANLGNNYFKITNGANSEIITLKDQNYSPSELEVEINAKLTASSHGSGMSFSIPLNINNKTSISSTVPAITIQFDVDKYGNNDKFNFKNKLGWLMGFRNTSYNVVSGTNTTVAECSIDLSGPRYLYLAIDEYNKGKQNSFISPLSSSLINKNIIARIAMDIKNHPYGTILPANTATGLLTTDQRNYTGKIDLQKLQIQLLNETGIPMTLNGQDFSFCLEVNYE